MSIRKRIFAFLLALAITPLVSVSASDRLYRKSGLDKKQIALTFDDGPSRQNTEAILEILDQYNIKATFFVIGQNAKKDPERIKLIYEKGHEIGNHTYTHAYISKISEEALKDEIQKTEEVLTEITGEKPKVFRPPGGFYSDASLNLVEKMGYQVVLWSLDTRDWSMPKSHKIAANVEENAGCGDIILFHDLEDARLPTPEALKLIIPKLIEEGYEFITVSEMIENEAD